MSLVLIASERFVEHTPPPGHPERPERAEVFDTVVSRWTSRGARRLDPRPATRDELLRVHSAEHVDRIAGAAGRAVSLDPDTFTSPESHDIALLAAGACCQGVDCALDERAAAVALVRPPGHHAERDRAMGFCLFNNAAVGAAYARARGLARVAVVDFDVHHGNGTQWMFYDDPSVLYASVHQYPFYPGTGAAAEIGRGAGAGSTVNVPLAAGATDADYDLAFRSVIVPVLDVFAPELLIVSAGYDAHHRDPLGGMRVTAEGFETMVAHLRGVVSRHGTGGCVVVVEGGYDLPALADGLDVTLGGLDADPAGPPVAPGGDASRARDALGPVRAILRPYWPTL